MALQFFFSLHFSLFPSLLTISWQVHVTKKGINCPRMSFSKDSTKTWTTRTPFSRLNTIGFCQLLLLWLQHPLLASELKKRPEGCAVQACWKESAKAWLAWGLQGMLAAEALTVSFSKWIVFNHCCIEQPDSIQNIAKALFFPLISFSNSDT